MAGSVNKVILVGNLGADPEVKQFQNGGQVCNLRIATSETWRDKASGERKEKTEWHAVAIFSEGLVKVAQNYLKKGSKVYLEGKLQTREWEDKEGNKRWTTEIVARDLQMLGRRGEGGGGEYSGGGGEGGDGGGDFGGAASSGPEGSGGSDEIPF